MLKRNSDKIKHLLVVRLSAMGDVAMLPHALRAFREAYPAVKITILTRALFKPFFKDLDVDFFVPTEDELGKGVMGLLRMAHRASALGVDAVVDVHDVWRTQIFTMALWLRGVKIVRIKKDRKEKNIYTKGGNIISLPPLKHTVIRYCDTLRKLGFEFDDPKPVIKTTCENPMGEKSGVWIGVAPFSAQRGKIYPADKIAEVVRLLSERYDKIFIHSGGGEEQVFASRMESLYPNVEAVFSRLKLDSEIDLISNLDCVVTMDSLVMHLASLVATPVVSVWGATHPALGYLGYGDYENSVVGLDIPCRPCSIYGKKECKYGDYRCLSGISPQIIVDKVAEVIKK